MCKIFHSVLNNRIRSLCERNNVFSPYMNDFRKMRYNLENLGGLRTNILIENKSAILGFAENNG